MNLVQLRITGTIVSSRYGSMSSGDILRTDDEYARHLVDDLKKARYDIISPSAPAEHAVTDTPRIRRKRSKPQGVIV